jgi:hypothetical protein
MESVVAWSPVVRDLYRRLRRAERLSLEPICGDPDYFDERPLFSREQWLAPIAGLPREERERAILAMGQWLWVDAELAIAKIPRRTDYALFLSVWEWEEGDAPVPYLFYCAREVSRVSRGIALERPTSPMAKSITAHLLALGLGSVAQVFEDRASVEGQVRVLIDFELSLNPHKRSLAQLAESQHRST